MAREEELKRIDLKVNVSCCDGCRRKVMKAMSLKGVLRTEIQPSHDRVTVVGDVDAKVLIKKLSKVGKIAEVLPAPAPSENGKKGGAKDGSDKPAQTQTAEEKGTKSKDGGINTAAPACKEEGCKKCTQKAAARSRATDGESGDDHASGKALIKDAGANAKSGDADGFSAKALAPAPPQVQRQHHYHRPEPAMVVPAAYYPPAPVAYYGGCYAMPPPPPHMAAMAMPVGVRRQLRPQPSRFDEDYFNDDNTVGCRVM